MAQQCKHAMHTDLDQSLGRGIREVNTRFPEYVNDERVCGK